MNNNNNNTDLYNNLKTKQQMFIRCMYPIPLSTPIP
jgi:hypothetical protein